MNHFDVAIIGSGPAGASAAFHLAKNGISTVLIEKEKLPRYKTCGGGFVYRGRKDLPFDISDIVEREFYKIDVFLGDSLHFTNKRENPIISMVMRDSFDNLLVEKAKELGVTLLQEHKLTSLEFSNGKNIITTSQTQLTATFVIAADGALSPTAKLAGWKEDTRKLIPALEYEVEVSEEDFNRLKNEVRFDIDAIPHGYAWSFPKKNHLSLGVASGKRTKINLKKFYTEYLETLGIKEVKNQTQHGFQIPVAPRTDGFVKNNVFLIGDAAGFADPITAEGISNAIYSGVLAAESIAEAQLNPTEAAALYNQKLEVKLIPEIKTGLWLSKWFYEQTKIRNLVLKKHGQRFSEAMADVFMGDRSYPTNIANTIKQKIKELVF
ncbi:geranylgeranyl reductase family protein [Tenacibaculum sp. IB213877]|uniref:NAD(P)/FAD-dependent oxidoreductase n=1 Tax=Tenacibaculum sp. IB213877 TaxID=3097351 RepID=UPI002A59C8E9|nr:geranylgeranyl reductase family protein [Tenacibaculum sp. IB213877]MDY0779872.1 geranylgeranyl reductase family protein [Tenacibaculum sp. IB213877]